MVFFLILSLCNNDIIIVFLKPIPMCELILFQDICVSDCIYFIFHFDQLILILQHSHPILQRYNTLEL